MIEGDDEMRSVAEPVEGYPLTRASWEDDIRPRIMDRFRDEIYGRAPEGQISLTWRVLEEGRTPEGQIRRQIAVTFSGPLGRRTATILVLLPPDREEVAAYVGLNFRGNHTCTGSTDILMAGVECPEATGAIHYENLLEEFEIPPPRGSRIGRWPLNLITDRGYAVVTMSYLQAGPDHDGIFVEGVHSILSQNGLHDRPATEWGAIGMWAWMLSRLQDALEQGMVPEINSSQVTVFGHSRLGKAALWAAAADQRFAAAISNDSGCMGAAMSRPVGETPDVLARIRPYWFTRNFESRALSKQPLGVDQHQLIACIAPRPVYVASASEDYNADPEGEFLSWREASQVWQLYGVETSDSQFPEAGGSVCEGGAPLGYHLRSGPHSVERFDWERWLDFCDRWVGAPEAVA